MRSDHHKSLLLSSGVLLTLFLCLTFFIAKGSWINSIDLYVTTRLQGLIDRNWDIPLSYFSLMGSFEITSLLLATIALVSYVKTKKIWYGLTAFFVGIGIELTGKIFLPHPSPPISFLRYNLGLALPSFSVQTGNSYPSGHMLRTSFILTILIFFVISSDFIKPYKIILICILLFIAVVMLFSRVYLGEHWLSDVLGGMLLGTGMGFISWLNYIHLGSKHQYTRN